MIERTDHVPAPVTQQEQPGSGALITADVGMLVELAAKHPRTITEFKKQLLDLVKTDRDTAEGCYYSLPPRAGTKKRIVGPSIRLAEMAASRFRNFWCAAEVQTITDKHVVARAFGLDLETNVAHGESIQRRITTRDGKRYSDDMIATTANAAISIAKRNVIFRFVRPYLTEAYHTARVIAAGDAATLKERREEIFQRLRDAFKITNDRILGAIHRKGMDDVTTDDLADLIGFGTAIKEEQTTVAETFPIIVQDEAAGERTKMGFAKKGKKPPEPAADPAVKESEPAAEEPEQSEDDDKPEDNDEPTEEDKQAQAEYVKWRAAMVRKYGGTKVKAKESAAGATLFGDQWTAMKVNNYYASTATDLKKLRIKFGVAIGEEVS
jgi:hypothetical protein